MISAIIVLFHPNINHLTNFLNKLLAQVDKVILVDNTPSINNKKFPEIFSYFGSNIIYLPFGENLGIATAHNSGIQIALELNSEYIIIFDQDSWIENNFIESLLKVDHMLREKHYKIAALGPSYIDIKTNALAPVIQLKGLKVKRITPFQESFFTQAEYIISSGSLFKADVFQKVGLMLEELFIDYVDLEWGLRAQQKGYNCFVANQTIMKHSIGDRSIKIPFSKKFVNIHSNFRKYFIVRNAFFLIFYSNLKLNWRVIQFIKTILYCGFLCIFDSPRFNNIRIFYLALKDAILKKMYKGSM